MGQQGALGPDKGDGSLKGRRGSWRMQLAETSTWTYSAHTMFMRELHGQTTVNNYAKRTTSIAYKQIVFKKM
jgi:hypothetical protein